MTAFYVFGAMAVAFSLLVVVKRSPVVAAFSLVVVFFSLAGMYATLGAHLVAALQVLVYAGAIMVLFAFVIMLLNARLPAIAMTKSAVAFRIVAAFTCMGGLAGFIWVFREGARLGRVAPAAATAEIVGGNTRAVSELLFTQFVLPFELTSVLLLAAIVGSVIIAKRKGVAR